MSSEPPLLNSVRRENSARSAQLRMRKSAKRLVALSVVDDEKPASTVSTTTANGGAVC